MSTELRESDYQALIDRENAKPEAMMRDQDAIRWAQGHIDDLKNPAAKLARDAFNAYQSANGKSNEADPLPNMSAYLLRCVNRCRPESGQLTVEQMKKNSQKGQH